MFPLKALHRLHTFFLAAALVAASAAAQELQNGGHPASTPPPQKKKQAQPAKGKNRGTPKAAQAGATPEAGAGLGWGSSIEVGRQARAAQTALKKHNYSAAVDYAQRAVKAAPQDPKLWFLLGYTSRLSGKLQQSVDAYNQGLKSQPSSPEGLSGLAQTFGKLGKTEDAKRLLMQVINAHPDRLNDILIAGELFMKSGDVQGGISLFQRAEAKKPSSHNELMLATGYMRLKQPEKAKALLAEAKRRDPKNVDVYRAVANY